MRLRVLFLALVWWVGSAALSSAVAQEQAPPPPEAKKAFADGKQAYDSGDYEHALQLFQRAALIAPAPSLYYNIGMAYERLGRYEDSALSFDKYLQLIEPPRDDKERTFQDNLRSRAAANHARARNTINTPPPQALIEPPRVAPGYAPYPYYGYPYGYGMPMVAPLTRAQRIEAARRHRNNGIALLSVGGFFLIVSIPLFAIAPAAHGDTNEGFWFWGAGSAALVGITLVIPGAVALAHWQKTLTVELRTPDDGAAARRAALDVAAPPVSIGNVLPGQLVLSTPAVRF